MTAVCAKRAMSGFAATLIAAACSEDMTDSATEPPAPPAVVFTQATPTEFDFPIAELVVLPPDAAPEDPESLLLTCAGVEVDAAVFSLDDGRTVVNPAADLPSLSTCAIRMSDGTVVTAFETALDVVDRTVIEYDRSDNSTFGPMPDDFYLQSDPTSPTGVRPIVPAPVVGGPEQLIFDALVAGVAKADGWSPSQPISLPLSDSIDSQLLPLDPDRSIAALSRIYWIDITPGAESFGERVPFKAQTRTETSIAAPLGETTLSLFPSVPLEPEHQYGVIITRRIGAGPGSPIEPSASFASILGAPEPGESDVITEARLLTEAVIDAANAALPVPLDGNDVAFAVRLTVRSAAPLTSETVDLRAAIDAAPAASFSLQTIQPFLPASPIAAVIRGTWFAPDFRDPVTGVLAKDFDGDVLVTGLTAVPCVLALPKTAASEPAPVILYQNGTPGDAEELIDVIQFEGSSANSLASEGFAMIGFTDPLNRFENPERMPSGMTQSVVSLSLDGLVATGNFPDFERQAWAEQFSFISVIKGLSELDLLPLAAGGSPIGDLNPDLAVDELLYLGISDGANKGMASLAYLNEIKAAALVVGGQRVAETLTVSGGTNAANFASGILSTLAISPSDAYAALGLAQIILDPEEPVSHAPRLYGDKVDLATEGRASILITEGIGDTLVPNNSTRATTVAYGAVAQLTPFLEKVVGLNSVDAPVGGNVDENTTAGYFQYAPDGLDPVPPSPGCEGITEGHFCAQISTAAIDQRIAFFKSALGENTPVIGAP